MIVCIRKGSRRCRTVGRTLRGHFGPLGSKDRRIQTRSRKPYAQQKVEDQNCDKAP